METAPICNVHLGYILACEVRGLVHGRHLAKVSIDDFATHYALAKLADAELKPHLDSGAGDRDLADLPHTTGLATAVVASPHFMAGNAATRRIWLRAANLILTTS